MGNSDYNGFQPTTPATQVRIPADGPIQFIDPPVNVGPKDITDMTLEEKVDEILLTMRTVGAALATFQKMGPGGMMKAMMTGNFTGGK
jgi:hypothetical protein